MNALPLGMAGREDVLVQPVSGDAFKKAISKSRLVRVAGAGRAAAQQTPASALEAIRDFSDGRHERC